MRPAPRLHPQQSYERPDPPTEDANREAIRQLLEEHHADTSSLPGDVDGE